MSGKVKLVIIDPQNDFCNPKDQHFAPKGSLYVPGADEDMKRLGGMVRKLGNRINEISVTFDSHHDLDVAHPIFWRNSEGKHPDWYQVITEDDVVNGVWFPTLPGIHVRNRMVEYVRSLQANGRYELRIWPPHCIIGTPGQNIYQDLLVPLREWCTKYYRTITPVTKGSNLWTEHYSAVKAEVPDPEDPTTQINTRFVQDFADDDISDILLAGEALSHCVASTFRDLVEAFGNNDIIKKMVLLTDACSNVPGCESYGEQFVKDFVALGMRQTTTDDYLA